LDENEIFENEDAHKDKYLIFSVGEASYGIPIRSVIEIIGIEEITQLPELPIYVKGIINLRGRIIPVMDARLRFRKEEREYDDRTCIIVIEIENVVFGLIVDNVKEVAGIDEANISPPPNISRDEDFACGFIEAIGKAGQNILLLIDCKRLLNNNELDD
jgi:Chemotaxis signal transduction protein